MSLKLNIKSAINLVNHESLGGLSDPYVTVSFQGEKKKTSVKSGTLAPQWNEDLSWDFGDKPPRPDETMEVELKDYERIGWNKLMGKATLPLRNLLQGGSGTLELEQPLLDAHDQPTPGLLKMTVTYTPPVGGRSTIGGGAAASTLAGGALVNQDMGDGIVEGAAAVTGGVPDLRGHGGDGGGQRERLANVPTKFQIRVRVVEARQLLGSDLSPVCRVKLLQQDGRQESQQTRVVRGSATPWFNQLFFFNVECLPGKLMESFIEFQVCNSSMLRSSTVIGSFKCEVGLVYDQAEHSLLNRWLVLTHPDEDTPTVQGYLKVSVAALGPGNRCPDMPASHSEAHDVEGNLLWAAGVHLQPASFAVSVYCAQDLPRMDSGTMQTLKEVLGLGKASKELVDPYLVVSYAGREVQTKVLYCCDNPEFRQTVHLGFLFPSMCNTLRLTLMDWDRVGQDDVIGTAVIPISAVSAAGDDGYLPTFGPSYVSFYGAQREWELWQSGGSEQQNVGEQEGVAFRGRVLISLTTSVGAYPLSPLTNMDVMDFERVRRFRSTRQFTLIAHLTHVSLLSEASRPLQVEVSCGNFGNKLENSLMPSPSTTHPANPVFDGCRYYYLAWGEAAPLVTVQCDWEDVTHRLYASNALTNAAKDLEDDLKDLKVMLRGKKKQEVKLLETIVVEVLQKAIALCSTPLPAPDPVRHSETSLDSHLRQRRRHHLDRQVAFCNQLLLGQRPTITGCEDVSDSYGVDTKGGLDVGYIVGELEGVCQALRGLAEEPQSSIPDVLLWLMSGTERLAMVRVPAQQLLHSPDVASAGSDCGQFQCYQLVCPITGEVGGLVRVSLWLGRTDEVRQWWAHRPDLQLTVYAESYENQVTSIGSGKWTCKGPLMTRPAFSDADGLLELKKESISCSEGWQFQGDWIVAPDPSIQYNLDAGHAVYSEEVFEQQLRVPGGTWVPAPTQWADARGDPATPRDEMSCPSGWAWRDFWAADLQRAVDCEGWEYTVQQGMLGWSPQQKMYHVLRRRRWCRERQCHGKAETSSSPLDGWEYSSLFGRRYHARERRVDVVRRRRWRRKMVPADPLAPHASPTIMVAGEKADALQMVSCPRQYVVSAERQRYQLRAHLYQGRDLPAGDKSGLSDPYAVVSFCELSQQTERQGATLCPTWDQTLLFDNVLISGPLLGAPAGAEMQGRAANPPCVVVNVFDWDARGAPEFLGRVVCLPTVQDPQHGYVPTPLRWHRLEGADSHTVGGGGELLASFELLLGGLEDAPPTRGSVYMLPFEVRPRLQKTRIEVLCWGVRNMATFDLQSVTRPSIEFECGGQRVVSTVMANCRTNPNFEQPHLSFDVELPREELYMPPLTLRVQDHRAFGSRPVVATAVVADLSPYSVEVAAAKRMRKTGDPFQFLREKLLQQPSVAEFRAVVHDKINVRNCQAPGAQLLVLNKRQESSEPGTVDTEVDWWAKYYASCMDTGRCGAYLAKGYEKLEVLNSPLEKDSRFSAFADLCTVPLMRGKGAAATQVGEFKGTFRVYPHPAGALPSNLPKLLSSYPSSAPCEILARVYVVLARDLAPKDSSGSSDPYVLVKLGKQSQSSIEEYRPNTLNPVFGQVFEVSGTLPVNKDLVVQVWDKDWLSSDDLIGETVIDLENRYLTRHRACVGLAKQYHVSGPNRWRDSVLPSTILEECARLRHHDLTWQHSPLSVTLDDEKYTMHDFDSPEGSVPPTLGPERECLSLHVLHRVFPLVTEHVETRDLSHPARPGLSQGKLVLWVDLFPNTSSIPPPVDITPRKPRKYEVRVVVYNVYGCPLQESNIAGERMSDVYVKGWLQGTSHVLKTDVHYRCLDGEANFNWRLVFPMEYLEAEQSMVVSRKSHFFSVDDTEERRPPQLTMQLWDNDLVLHDDFLSEMTLDLCKLPKPYRHQSKVIVPSKRSTCTSTTSDGFSTSVLLSGEDDREQPPLVNLFQVKRVSGFFPFTRVVDGVTEVAGLLEAELEVLNEDEFKERPAGLGRDPPNLNPTLPEPNRPATSFFWLSSPWKSFKHVVWKNYKWYIITLLVLFFLLLFIFLFLYSIPGATIDYLI